VVPIHTIEKGHLIPILFQDTANCKESDRLDPKIIGCKIDNPGIDEKNLALTY